MKQPAGGGVVSILIVARQNCVRNKSDIQTRPLTKMSKINNFEARKKVNPFPDGFLLDPVDFDQKHEL